LKVVSPHTSLIRSNRKRFGFVLTRKYTAAASNKRLISEMSIGYMLTLCCYRSVTLVLNFYVLVNETAHFGTFIGKATAKERTFPMFFPPAVFSELKITWKIQFLPCLTCESKPFHQVRTFHDSHPLIILLIAGSDAIFLTYFRILMSSGS
jgi:hypothetical protein